eukprot:GHUV01057697.1.p1 GENE.GHUV01057697.1~~GHUV01057697.1.p1  ORF type:complete len:144 (-),score=35.07 GHUV01057697.1:606-1037(-)
MPFIASLLQAQYRGFFVPPRPEKNAVEGQRMSDSFVEERRASLQKYVQKLAAHPVIGHSEAVRVFLESPGDLSSNMRWSNMQPSSASLMEGTAKFSKQLIGRESRVRRGAAGLSLACVLGGIDTGVLDGLCLVVSVREASRIC